MLPILSSSFRFETYTCHFCLSKNLWNLLQISRFTFYNIQKYRGKILPLLKSQYHNIGMEIFFHHPHFFRIQSWSRNKFYSQQLNKKLNFLILITPNIIIILLQYSTNKAWNIQPPEEILQNPSNFLNQAEYPNQQQQATFNKSFSTRGDRTTIHLRMAGNIPTR